MKRTHSASQSWMIAAAVTTLIGVVGPALAGPYASAAGQAGSTAIAKNAAWLTAWATGYENYVVGQGVNDIWQKPQNGLGAANGTATDIVCLGDGGQITLTFARPISDGPGADLAVFENGFSDGFLELGWVEVSSDGENFFRFPSHSLTASPVPFVGGSIDPTNIDGLAGKYRAGYGTPFDLSQLAGKAGLNTGLITQVRIVDIVGDGSAHDSDGRIIYDPFPTMGSAGFDLDAVGVLHQTLSGDANGDGMVDVGDLGILGANYGAASGAGWTRGDFTGDGAVDVGDLGVLGAQYGQGVSAGAVPEPATLGLLLAGGLAVRRRR